MNILTSVNEKDFFRFHMYFENSIRKLITAGVSEIIVLQNIDFSQMSIRNFINDRDILRFTIDGFKVVVSVKMVSHVMLGKMTIETTKPHFVCQVFDDDEQIDDLVSMADTFPEALEEIVEYAIDQTQADITDSEFEAWMTHLMQAKQPERQPEKKSNVVPFPNMSPLHSLNPPHFPPHCFMGTQPNPVKSDENDMEEFVKFLAFLAALGKEEE